MPVILTFLPGTCTLGVRRTPHQTDSDVTFQIVQSAENHRKRLKENSGCLIDFLSQISTLSYFNLLDLGDFCCITIVSRFFF